MFINSTQICKLHVFYLFFKSAKSESVKSERNLQTIDASQNDVTYPREWVNGATSQDETYQIVEV